MIHWPALAWTCRPSMVMVTGSPVLFGCGGAVPTALSVTVGRWMRRTGTGWTWLGAGTAVPGPLGSTGSDTGQPPGQPVGREGAAAFPDVGQVLVAEHLDARGHGRRHGRPEHADGRLGRRPGDAR